MSQFSHRYQHNDDAIPGLGLQIISLYSSCFVTSGIGHLMTAAQRPTGKSAHSELTKEKQIGHTVTSCAQL